MASKRNIGDIIEIKTAAGYAYALCTHHHERYGALIRVWNTQYQRPAREFEQLLKMPVSFSCFFPLSAAVRRSIVSIVCRIQVPAKLATFPTFRAAGTIDRSGKVLDWWLWDGEGEWKVGTLTQQQRKLPIRQILNDTALKQLIETEWTPDS